NAAGQAPDSWEPWMADVAENTRWSLAFILLLLGRPTEADEAVSGVPPPATGGLWVTYYTYLERYDEARSSIERELRSSRATGDVWNEMLMTRSLAFVDLLEGRFPAARAGAARSLGMAESIGVPGVIAFNLSYLAWLAAVEGRESEAREDVARADDLAQLGV